MRGKEPMKAQKISYSKDVDILMIQLSDKKLDDSYEVGNMIVQVAEDGEPVIIEIMNASAFLKQAASKLPKKVLESVLPSYPATLHNIK